MSAYNQEEAWFPTPLISGRLSSTWLPTESEAPSLKKVQKRVTRILVRLFASEPKVRAFFLRVSPALRVFPARRFPFPRRFAFSRRFEFSRSFAFPWRFAFPGDSSFLAVRVSWRFPCPGDSRVLATPNTSCGLASRALVVLQLTSTQSRFLVAFGAPAPSS